MDWLHAALDEAAGVPHPESLDTFRSHIDPTWVEEALSLTQSASMRRRRLPPEQVIWLVLGMALMRNRPITEVASKLELVLPDSQDRPVARSAVSQARQRVGAEPLRWLFERSAQQWAHGSAFSRSWRGLALYAIDGTGLSVADSEDNREHFGLASSGPRGHSGYPLVQMTVLMALRSHLVAAAEFGPYRTSEHTQAKALLPQIPAGSLTILDRGFYSGALLTEIAQQDTDRHWLVRTPKNAQWTVQKSFGRYDKLVEVEVSGHARGQDPALPRRFVARAISYRHPRSSHRQWLLTSLTDPEQYPAEEIVALYHERWEIELGYDEIKTHMLEREETIRSRSVQGVCQELWGILLAYNLIRLEMDYIADEAEVLPSRISFVMAMRYIRDEWGWCAVASPGSIPRKLRRMRQQVARFVLPERRSERNYPRAVKVKMSNFPRKRRKNDRKATN